MLKVSEVPHARRGQLSAFKSSSFNCFFVSWSCRCRRRLLRFKTESTKRSFRFIFIHKINVCCRVMLSTSSSSSFRQANLTNKKGGTIHLSRLDFGSPIWDDYGMFLSSCSSSSDHFYGLWALLRVEWNFIFPLDSEKSGEILEGSHDELTT